VVTPSVAEILGHLTLRTEARDSVSSPVIEIPVLYDGEDLAELEMTVGPSVVDLHTKGEYQVQFIGFMPGFPYLSGLPDVLRGIPRRSSPRTRVPAGSVAIAEEYCGIYPAESPGGWWLLGRTPLSVCDPVSDYFLLKPGDRVQFRSITEQEFEDFP
jgi:inhibitor of KinA